MIESPLFSYLLVEKMTPYLIIGEQTPYDVRMLEAMPYKLQLAPTCQLSTSPKPSTKRTPPKRDRDDDQQRVILLLDMDCFYAQCESVRLGLDPDIPLALIQVYE